MAALEIRGTIHAELSSLWSLFPASSLGQKMFANNELVSVHAAGAQVSSSGLSTGSSWPWPAVYRWPLMGCLKLPLADAKTEGFGVFRSLDSLISLFLHLLAIPSACQYLWRSVLCFSSLFPLCLLRGSSFSSQGAGALRVELLQSCGQRNVCAACSHGGSLQMKLNEIQFQNTLTCISVTHPWLTSGG